MQTIAGMDFARWLRLIPIRNNAAELAGAHGEGARLEEARRPEPLVYSDTGANTGAEVSHDSIVVQQHAAVG
jgi:hypothetical protein